MGKLIKNHWARLVVLAAAVCTAQSFGISLPGRWIGA